MDPNLLRTMPWHDKAAENTSGGGKVEDKPTDDGTGDNVEDAGKKPVFTDEQQKFINELIGNTRITEREKLRKEAEAQAAKDKADAEKKKLEEQGEFKKLADAAEQKAKDAESRAQQAEAKAAQLVLQRQFETALSEAGVKFVNPKAAEDAFTHLDVAAVGEDFKGLPAAVKKLVEERGYLFEETTQVQNIDATAKGKLKPSAAKKSIIDSKRKSYNPL